MFSGHRKARVLFGVSDILFTTLAFEAAYQTRSLWHLGRLFYLTPEQHALVLGFALLAWVGIAEWLGIYEKLGSAHPRIILRDTARQCVYGALALVIFEWLLRLDLSRPLVFLFACYAWTVLLVFRLTAARLVGVMRREFGQPYHVMLVGTGERAVRLADALENSTDHNVKVRGLLSERAPASPGPSGERSFATDSRYPVWPISNLPSILREHVVDEVLFAVDTESLPYLEETFLLCDEEGVRTALAVDFFPHVNSTLSLDRFGPVPLLTFSATPYDEIRLLVKRLTDVSIAAAGLLVLAPFMAAIAVAIRLTSPGPAIFTQERCGLNGRRFRFFKFRSMVLNAEALKPTLAHLTTRQTAFKIPDDPRVTTLGRYLRRFSIDEWPQLWNVLRGDMSLVGPRPAVPSEVEQYQNWQRRRLRMRPGLTCLWAISGRDLVDFETWMKMDMQYIDNWSLALDWKILLRTIPRLVTGHGAS